MGQPSATLSQFQTYFCFVLFRTSVFRLVKYTDLELHSSINMNMNSEILIAGGCKLPDVACDKIKITDSARAFSGSQHFVPGTSFFFFFFAVSRFLCWPLLANASIYWLKPLHFFAFFFGSGSCERFPRLAVVLHFRYICTSSLKSAVLQIPAF